MTYLSHPKSLKRLLSDSLKVTLKDAVYRETAN